MKKLLFLLIVFCACKKDFVSTVTPVQFQITLNVYGGSPTDTIEYYGGGPVANTSFNVPITKTTKTNLSWTGTFYMNSSDVQKGEIDMRAFRTYGTVPDSIVLKIYINGSLYTQCSCGEVFWQE